MTQLKKVANDNNPSFLGKLRKWVEVSTAISALNRLDDRTLLDIGLKRSEIKNFVHSWSIKNDNAA